MILLALIQCLVLLRVSASSHLSYMFVFYKNAYYNFDSQWLQWNVTWSIIKVYFLTRQLVFQYHRVIFFLLIFQYVFVASSKLIAYNLFSPCRQADYTVYLPVTSSSKSSIHFFLTSPEPFVIRNLLYFFLNSLSLQSSSHPWPQCVCVLSSPLL